VRDAGIPDLVAGREAGRVVSRTALFERLWGSARVTVVSAPPGSGKTALLRSWISETGLAERAAWVSAGRGERDPQPFWLSVLAALRGTAAGSVLVQPVSAAPGLDGWALVEQLLNDLALLAEPVWLVIDDVHELDPDQVLRQLELLVLRAPPQLRFVLAARHDVRLGLHRLRLEGGLTEIRAGDLRFSLAEASELFAAAGIELPGAAVVMVHERTEGWAAGLRMAALSLAGHPDPGRFAVEFSGSERTVAEYLLAEVLDRQGEQVRRLLLRTSVLERVNGELADLLAGGSGGERVLQDLEQANAFVVSLDASRSWFRYHQMFAGLLQLELRRAAPEEVTALHRTAAGWFSGHGYPVEAVRHAQAAQDWALAARLLADHWPGLHLEGQATTVRELIARFPARARAADAELAAVAAAGELTQGSLEQAERYLGGAERGSAWVPAGRRGQFQVLLGIVRLSLARQRGDVPAVAQEAQRMRAVTEDPDAAHLGLGEELRALALITVGVTEFWAAQLDQAERHLDQGVALAQQIGRPYLEFLGLAHQAAIEIYRSFTRAAERSMQAIELAERHGWTDDPAAGVAYVTFAGALAWQGRPGEAEPWLQRAERTVRAEAEPAAGMAVHYLRGRLELARGRDADALAALFAAERLAGRLSAPHLLIPRTRASLVHTLVRLGDTERAEQALGDFGEHDRERAEIRMATAALRLAQHDPHAAAAVLGPVLDGSVPVDWPPWGAQAFWLEAIARDALGDPAAAGRALERALDLAELAEPDGALQLFLLYPAPGLLERQAGHRTAHPALIADLISQLAGQAQALPAGPQPLLGPLRDSEVRVLRYLPTNLTLPEIARELHISHNTVKTHIRSLYTQLGAHRRTEAVERARALGLLARTAHRR
jgi:LuxR family transcriptional regulator, maltose regulon positive regulatory protein